MGWRRESEGGNCLEQEEDEPAEPILAELVPQLLGGLLAHLQLQPVRCGPLQGALLTATQVILSCMSNWGHGGPWKHWAPGVGEGGSKQPRAENWEFGWVVGEAQRTTEGASP